MNSGIIALGGGICVVWGLGHLMPTRSIISMFGELSVENRRILTMEWVAEGLTLVFLGVLALLVALAGDGGATARLVIRATAVMLVVMAGLTLMTGARTPILAMRLCPWVKLTAATLLLIGA